MIASIKLPAENSYNHVANHLLPPGPHAYRRSDRYPSLRDGVGPFLPKFHSEPTFLLREMIFHTYRSTESTESISRVIISMFFILFFKLTILKVSFNEGVAFVLIFFGYVFRYMLHPTFFNSFPKVC